MLRDTLGAGSRLDDLPLYLPRLFYAFLGLVERRLAATGLGEHLRPGMGHVLLALYEQDDCIIKDISRRTQMATGTLTGLLKKMEEAGLVDCRKCREDGRAVRVRLTKLGRALEPRMKEFHEEIIATLQQGMSAKDVEAAHGLFTQLLQTMRQDEENCRTKRDLKEYNRSKA
jgi:DNA-binding MarR family transcriptional regulator